MRILAIARPNKKYMWYSNIESIHYEARLSNNKVYFYEIDTKQMTERCVSEENVWHMFRLDKPIKKQPFLARENRDFYIILNRDKAKYIERFNEIKLKSLKKYKK